METLEDMRNNLLQIVREDTENLEYCSGYIDGVLDMYNKAKLEKGELVNA